MAVIDTVKFGFILTLLVLAIFVFKFNLFGLKCESHSRSFTIDFVQNVFLKDGEPFQYISGSIHYSRVPEIYWYDRLLKMKAAGLNTIQIYVPWNFHEYVEGQYDFSGNKDLNKFLTIANNLELLVLLRSGPYMCGEWDFGGLPAWLLKNNPQMKLRSSSPDYMSAVSRWYAVLMKILKPHLYQNNGSIIMVQVENEYGSYFTCDDIYLRNLYNIVRFYLGNDIIIYSTDGNGLSYLKCGSSDRRIFSTVDFGTTEALNPGAAFSALKIFQPRGPLVNSEYYTGWLDSWGHPFQEVPLSNVVNGLKTLYNYSKSVNINMYMFHGGTTFGYWNGANSPPYLPQITSYDYDAPITEAGDTTLKYVAIRKFIQSLSPNTPLPPIPENISKVSYGTVNLVQQPTFLTTLLNVTGVRSQYPLTMEALDQFQGFMMYICNTEELLLRKEKLNETYSSEIKFSRIADFAYIFSSNDDNSQIIYQGMLNRDMKSLSLNINVNVHVMILMENAGHVNYGRDMMNDVKGIVGNVTLDKNILTNWRHISIDISKQRHIPNSLSKETKSAPTQAALYTGSLYINFYPSDTFILLPSFSKGVLFLNGRNVGRYWNSRGPQLTLYIPASFLNIGLNHITVFELEGSLCRDYCYVKFIDYPILNGTVHNNFKYENIFSYKRH